MPCLKMYFLGFPGGSVVKNLPASAGDTGSIPEPEKSHRPGTTKPVHHNSWACALETHVQQLLSNILQLLKPAWPTAPAPQVKPAHCN